MEFELKPLSKEAIPGALERAKTYRLLNEPLEAESICRDVMASDPTNQLAIIELILALTEQFPTGKSGLVAEAEKLLNELESPYHQAYYRGFIFERRAKAQLAGHNPGCGGVVYDWLRNAMHFYETAQNLQTETNDNDESVLRWNTCVRIIMANPELCPTDDDGGAQEVHMFD